jgi:hypothetical protein
LGLIYGLICGLIWQTYGIFGAESGLIFGLTFGLIGDKIQAIETLKFSFKNLYWG